MGLCDHCQEEWMNYYCYEKTRNGRIEVHLCKDCFKRSEIKYIEVIK